MLNNSLKNKYQIKLNRYIKGKKIKNINYLVNIPLEDNCLKITFDDNSYLLVYALMRISVQGRIVLSSADFYFDKNFKEVNSDISLENTIMYDALKKTNTLLFDNVVDNVVINGFGDLVVFVGTKALIEIYIDTPENDKYYYSYFGNVGTYFLLCKLGNQLSFIEDKK